METTTQKSKTPSFLRMAAVCFTAVFAVAACSEDSDDSTPSAEESESTSNEESVERQPAEEPFDIIGEEVAADGQHAQRVLLEEGAPTLDDVHDAARNAIECGNDHDTPLVLYINIFDTERPMLSTDLSHDFDDHGHAFDVQLECSNAHLGLVLEAFGETLGPAVPEDEAWQDYIACLDARGIEYDSEGTNLDDIGVEEAEYMGSCEYDVRVERGTDILEIDLS